MSPFIFSDGLLFLYYYLFCLVLLTLTLTSWFVLEEVFQEEFRFWRILEKCNFIQTESKCMLLFRHESPSIFINHHIFPAQTWHYQRIEP